MKKIRIEWVFLFMWLCLMAMEIKQQNVAWSIGDGVAGILSFFLLRWTRTRGEKPEPVPVGPTITDKAPKDNWFREHLAEHPDCVLCRNLGWIE